MGDLNAVDVAQAVHAQIFTESLADGDLLLECGEPLPARGLLPGVYIDDTLVAWLCKESQVNVRRGPDVELLSRVHKRYEQVGLPKAPEKGFGICAGGGGTFVD